MFFNFFNFFWVFKGYFNKLDCNFDEVKKISYYRPSLKKVFWNKGHEVIISFHNVINKILSRD